MRVLIVDDEEKIAAFIARAFSEEAYESVIAGDGAQALGLCSVESFDLLVLDVMLPVMDGFETLRELRRRKLKLPVLMLTALDSVSDRVRGLDAGADDYLSKPFSVEELLARSRALLRRAAGVEDLLRVADLELDRATLRVSRGGRLLDLTKREFALLEYLMQNPGRIATRSLIAEHVWGIDFDSGTNTIDVYIKYLRDKIDSGQDRKLIKTVRGRGYVIDDGAAEKVN